jgi:transporter family protein
MLPRWLIFALLSAVAAAFVPIFGKIGLPSSANSNVATTIRGIVMALLLCIFCTSLNLWRHLETIPGKAYTGIILSGVAGAASWLFYYHALQIGAVSNVAPIDKLSVPFSVLLAVLVFREHPNWLNWIGVLFVAIGAYLTTLKLTR